MTVLGAPVSGGTSSNKDGANVTADDLQSAANFPAGFTAANGWKAEDGKLPGVFGEAVDMPPHLRPASAIFQGSGNSTAPYEIHTAKELAMLATLVNAGNTAYYDKYFVLMSDLALSIYAVGTGWTPIGDGIHPFLGHFDGNGKTISGLTINEPGVGTKGLFGSISGGSVSNLGLVNVDITGGDNTGGLVGVVSYFASVTGCYVTGRVSGNNYTGGVAGYVNTAIGHGITNCSALNPSVSASDGSTYAGRVAGNFSSGYHSGNIAFDGMTVNGSTVSGVADNNKEGADVTAERLQAAANFPGGFDSAPWTTENGKLPGLFGTAANMPSHLRPLASKFAGSGTVAAPYEIHTAEELAELAALVNANNSTYRYAHYILLNDLDLSGYANWTPIGSNYGFRGHFDGNNKTIASLTINNAVGDNIGLFGRIDDLASVSDLGVINANIAGRYTVGGLVGRISSGSSVTGCYVTGSVSGNTNVGGVAGLVGTDISIASCYVIATVSGDICVGGVVGTVEAINSSARITDCYSTGAVNGNDYVGGVVGITTNASITNCYVTGSVSASGGKAGGIAGDMAGNYSSRSIVNCAAMSSIVSGVTDIGRVLGSQSGNGTLGGNHAFAGMTGYSGTDFNNLKTHDDLDGQDIDGEALLTTGFWTDTANWSNTSTWGDPNVWVLQDGQLPLLVSPRQAPADLPLFITPMGQIVEKRHLLVNPTLPATVAYDGNPKTVSVTENDAITGGGRLVLPCCITAAPRRPHSRERMLYRRR